MISFKNLFNLKSAGAIAGAAMAVFGMTDKAAARNDTGIDRAVSQSNVTPAPMGQDAAPVYTYDPEALTPPTVFAYNAPEAAGRPARGSSSALLHYVDQGKICVAATGACFSADSGRGRGLNNSSYAGHTRESPAPNGVHFLTRHQGSRWTGYGPVWLLGNTPGRSAIELHGPVPLMGGAAGSLGCIKVNRGYGELVREMAAHHVDRIITIPGGGQPGYARRAAPDVMAYAHTPHSHYRHSAAGGAIERILAHHHHSRLHHHWNAAAHGHAYRHHEKYHGGKHHHKGWRKHHAAQPMDISFG